MKQGREFVRGLLFPFAETGKIKVVDLEERWDFR